MDDAFDQLEKAISVFDIPAVRRLVAAGADLNACHKFGEPFLFNAIFALSPYDDSTNADRRRCAVIAELIDLGADPRLLADDGCSILIGPMFSQDTEMVELLLDRGVDPNHGCGEPWETVYELALFDYCYETGLVFGSEKEEVAEPAPLDDEDGYVEHLDRRAQAKGQTGPEIPLLLRRYGALANGEMARKLGGDCSQRIEWRDERWHLKAAAEASSPSEQPASLASGAAGS